MGAIRENIRKNLSIYIALRRMSQKEFAEKLGVSQSSVTCWVKGKNSPDIEMVALICEVLQISVLELFGMEKKSQYSFREQELIEQYRSKPELQRAVDILLDMDDR